MWHHEATAACQLRLSNSGIREEDRVAEWATFLHAHVRFCSQHFPHLVYSQGFLQCSVYVCVCGVWVCSITPPIMMSHSMVTSQSSSVCLVPHLVTISTIPTHCWVSVKLHSHLPSIFKPNGKKNSQRKGAPKINPGKKYIEVCISVRISVWLLATEHHMTDKNLKNLQTIPHIVDNNGILRKSRKNPVFDLIFEFKHVNN